MVFSELAYMLLSTPRLDITLQDCVTPGDWGGTHWDYNVDAHWNYTNCLLDYWSLAAWAYYHDYSTLAHSSTCSILLFAFVRYCARSDSYESNHARKVLLSILLSSSSVPTLVYLWTLCRTERRNPELLRKKTDWLETFDSKFIGRPSKHALTDKLSKFLGVLSL